MKKATNQELKRIKDYLRTKGMHATNDEIITVAITVTERLGAGVFTFYSELEKCQQQK